VSPPSRLNYGHSLADEGKPTHTAEIIRRANHPPPLPPKPSPPRKMEKRLELEVKWKEEIGGNHRLGFGRYFMLAMD
jgi:hypothetical protein